MRNKLTEHEQMNYKIASLEQDVEKLKETLNRLEIALECSGIEVNLIIK